MSKEITIRLDDDVVEGLVRFHDDMKYMVDRFAGSKGAKKLEQYLPYDALINSLLRKTLEEIYSEHEERQVVEILERLNAALDERNITVEEMAKRIGMGVDELRTELKNPYELSTETVLLICEELKINQLEMFEERRKTFYFHNNEWL